MQINRILAIEDASSAAINAVGGSATRINAAKTVLIDHGFGEDIDALTEAMQEVFPGYEADVMDLVIKG